MPLRVMTVEAFAKSRGTLSQTDQYVNTLELDIGRYRKKQAVRTAPIEDSLLFSGPRSH